MQLSTLAVALSHLALLTAAAPQVYRAFPSATRAPRPWRLASDQVVKKDHVVHMLIALKASEKDAFEKIATEVSDPSHANYGKHLSKDEVDGYFKPDAKAVVKVNQWLESAGVKITDVHNDGRLMDLEAPVSTVEKLLNTKLAWYTDGDSTVLRTVQYTIPESIAKHVLHINPLTRFPVPIEFGNEDKHSKTIMKRTNTGGAVPGSLSKVLLPHCNMTVGMTPDCIKQLYNFNDDPSPDSKSILGIAGYGYQSAKHSYLQEFLTNYHPQAAADNATFTFHSIEGAINNETDTTHNDHEGNLDVQYGVSLAYPLRDVRYYITKGHGPIIPDLDTKPGTNPNEPFLETILYLLGLPNKELPQTLTVSYGEDEQTNPKGYMDLVCSMFAQLGARGVSVIFASGDSGPGSSCLSNDGKNTTTFNPIFPASCPWVTSVGGVYSYGPEIAMPISTGGFSSVFPRPKYQEADAEKYLKYLGGNWTGLYNPKGRAFPDVSAQGYDFKWMERGQTGGFSGTSAAAPTFAAVIARINAARLAAGKPPMGFLNPWLYSVGRKGLNDVTVGESFGCSGKTKFTGVPAGFVKEAGFNATEGWDAVTGLGTPDLGKLMKLAMHTGY